MGSCNWWLLDEFLWVYLKIDRRTFVQPTSSHLLLQPSDKKKVHNKAEKVKNPAAEIQKNLEKALQDRIKENLPYPHYFIYSLEYVFRNGKGETNRFRYNNHFYCQNSSGFSKGTASCIKRFDQGKEDLREFTILAIQVGAYILSKENNEFKVEAITFRQGEIYRGQMIVETAVLSTGEIYHRLPQEKVVFEAPQLNAPHYSYDNENPHLKAMRLALPAHSGRGFRSIIHNGNFIS